MSKTMSKIADHRLLVIDDDTDICDLLQEIGQSCGYETATTTKITDFISTFTSFKPTIIILDLSIADRDGIEILRFLSNESCRSPIVMLSGYDEKVRATAFRLGQSYGLEMITHLQKPIDVTAIKNLLLKGKKEILSPTAERLAKAISDFEMVLHYQPKINIKTSKVVGVESLVRWKPAAYPIMLPDIFISLAEHTGLIKQLTYWVVKEAFQQWIKWKDKGFKVKISINLSPTMLNDLLLPDDLHTLAVQYKVDPTYICFEVTEAGVMSRPQLAMDILTRLRLKGFSLSIDDFGTGYSSLTELHRMPFSELKIDRSFTLNVFKEQEAWTIIRSIIELGHNLGLKVTAEGVETQEMWKKLKTSECDSAQGFFLCVPMAATDYEKWYGTHKPANYS